VLPALVGCHTWNPAPLDLAGPGWTVVHGQAVWHPAGRDLELAGEMLLATRPAGNEGYLQFGKGPMTLAESRTDGTHWLAHFPAMNREFSGRGPAPGRLAWSQLLRIATGQAPSADWTWTGSLEDRWRLEHRRSGEWIEGTRLR